MPANPFLLAADNPAALLPLLREQPQLASQQDEHGYSLVHAAASYNHLDLLRALVSDFGAPVDLRDEDRETALFVVETVEAARCLVEELGLDPAIAGDEGKTARQKIQEEGDFPLVAEYLAGLEQGSVAGTVNGAAATNGTPSSTTTTTGETSAPAMELPPVPEGLAVTMGTMAEPQEVADLPDPEFRRRIEQLAEREDFHTPEGQAELRRLVQDAIAGEDLAEDRNVRQRQE
ncbi:uncharacterized protein E0L32_007804 [Thyridium curvatum]|uniref:Uncharacterized protein n=1 Tax=Thyridium curvatum TaxID=1093900 RepID=A0A507AV44_9PEZI|nr:uncharacterized protein E0L32_007804 [Thyridium curvatum]TPX11593.1 hypothetical protein E0L32_007804 [Thyridium curvatum]